MADPTVHITNGVPDSGTGNITTLGQTLLDGANVTIGAKGDTAWVSGSGSMIAILKAIVGSLGAALAAGTNLIGKVGFDQTTAGTTNGVSVAYVGANAVLAGSGATGTGAQRVTVATDQATNAGAALVKGGVGVVNGGSAYNTVAASTALKLSATQGGGTGAIGDYLSHVVIIPSTTSPGAVTLTDGSGSAITIFAGGASSVSNLVPFAVPIGAVSTSGGWTLTTLGNETAIGFGKFS